MEIEKKKSIKKGIYEVRLRLDEEMIYEGVESLGRRKKVEEEGENIIEKFILDF